MTTLPENLQLSASWRSLLEDLTKTLSHSAFRHADSIFVFLLVSIWYILLVSYLIWKKTSRTVTMGHKFWGYLPWESFHVILISESIRPQESVVSFAYLLSSCEQLCFGPNISLTNYHSNVEESKARPFSFRFTRSLYLVRLSSVRFSLIHLSRPLLSRLLVRLSADLCPEPYIYVRI